MTVLGSWYSEAENYDKPLVVIVDDMERCNGNVLSDFVLLLSEWVIKVPIVLVMGVATTVDAPRSLLRANALCRLQPCKFALGSPADKLYAVAEAVVLRSHCGFDIGYKVAVFLRNYFLRQDGTVTSFIRALKIACAKHFVMEPLSFLCKVLVDEDSQGLGIEKLPASMLDYAFGLPSCQTSKKATPVTAESLASGLIEMKKLRKNWCSVLVCLYEAAKFQNIQFLDILCEALDPSLYSSRASPNHKLGKAPIKPSSINHCLPDGEYSARGKGGLIFQVIRKVKDLPVTSLFQLLQVWGKHSEEIADIHGKVKELQSMLKIEDDSNNLQCDETGTSKSPASRCHMNKERDRSKVNEKAAVLLECMIRGYLTPIESAPFHEIVCFKHVDVLQSALIGDPRKMIQVDLLKSHNYLHCSCCTKNGSVLLPSMHDTSIMYTLAQEHGDLINLHDWFQSFKSTIFRSSTSVKRKLHSPSPKKRKLANEPEEVNNALVQARFCRAVMELQITGLLRMPSKRRPDYVQRVAFGL
ncbi:hypothetical protein IFM89_023526 [Coptis chinensis]|uniref:Origin of replication complex subunit 3 n=1 Tax=Coptis chinensis TaxID=261450 RepID=A0A835LSJ4_9MAGN|nr:hypothetical protein IFM89_023526 [Coptis chinensis]